MLSIYNCMLITRRSFFATHSFQPKSKLMTAQIQHCLLVVCETTLSCAEPSESCRAFFPSHWLSGVWCQMDLSLKVLNFSIKVISSKLYGKMRASTFLHWRLVVFVVWVFFFFLHFYSNNCCSFAFHRKHHSRVFTTMLIIRHLSFCSRRYDSTVWDQKVYSAKGRLGSYLSFIHTLWPWDLWGSRGKKTSSHCMS